MHNKVIKYIIIIIIGMPVSVLMLLMFLNSERGRIAVLWIVNKYSPVRIELNGLKLNIFKGQFFLEDLRIFDKENIKMGGIGKLFIDMQLKPVFSGKYVIDSLLIEDLYADINSDQIKLFLQKDEEKGSKVLDLTVKNIIIQNTDIKYCDIIRSAKYGLKNYRITASVNIRQSDYFLKLEDSKVRINSPMLIKTLINDSLTVASKKSKLEIKPANFKTVETLPVEAVIEGSIDLSSVFEKGVKPEDISVNIRINTRLSPFSFKKFHLKKPVDLKADMDWINGKLISTISLMRDNSKLSLKGNTTLFDEEWHILKDPEIYISLTGNNIPSKEFYPEIDTELNISVNAEGRLNSLSGNYDLTTTEIKYSGIEIENVSAKGKFTGRDIILESLDIACGGNNIFAEGEINDSNYSIRADLKKWDYTYLIPDSMNRNLNGFINGYIEGKGNLKQLQEYRIIADLDSIILNLTDKNIVSGNKFKAEFTKDMLKIENFRLDLLSEGFLEAEGYMDTGKNLNFSIQTNLPIQSLAAFQPVLYDSEGFVKGDFEIKGIMGDPEFKGRIYLDKISFIIPVTMQKVYDLNSEIVLASNKINIKSFSGGIEKGKFSFEGSVDLSDHDIKSSTLIFKSVDLPVIYPDYFQGTITSNLNYSGDLNKGRLRGDLILMEGLYYQDFDPFGKAFIDKGTKILKSAARNDSLPDVSLDLTLKSRHSIVVDNSSAFIELNPDIKIKGSLSKPLITGRTTMQKGGFIVFQKNTFSVTRGVLDFAPVHGIFPVIDIESESTISDYTIFLSISGNLKDPRFLLSSEPQKSQSEILTILLLGKNVNEFLKGNETAVSGTKEKFLANWIHNTFQHVISKKFGLDYLEFTVTDGFSDDDTSGTGLTIGKNISDRLTLKYSASNDASEFIQKGTADYQFFENMIFSGFQTTAGKFGAEIKYKLEFR